MLRWRGNRYCNTYTAVRYNKSSCEAVDSYFAIQQNDNVYTYSVVCGVINLETPGEIKFLTAGPDFNKGNFLVELCKMVKFKISHLRRG